MNGREGPTCEEPLLGSSQTLQEEEASLKEASLKAMTLLQDTIGNNQFLQLVANGYFSVIGQYGIWEIPLEGRLSLKTETRIGNKIRPLTWSLCVDIEKQMPRGDKILARYLAITGDEDKIINTANFRGVSTVDEYTERQGLNVGNVCCEPQTTIGSRR